MNRKWRDISYYALDVAVASQGLASHNRLGMPGQQSGADAKAADKADGDPIPSHVVIIHPSSRLPWDMAMILAIAVEAIMVPFNLG